MPAVGTPESNGLEWNEVLRLFKSFSQKRKVVGIDFVELCSINKLVAPDFLAAKLIYKFISYLVKFQRL